MPFPLIRLGVVDSTQSHLSRHPELGFCGVMADAQTAGRGRGGNSWESAPGAGLWLSARLPQPSSPPGIILQNAMAAVIEVLAHCGVALGMKWPNDLVAHRLDGTGEKKLVKIGGIIGEYKENSVVLGLGLNIFSAPDIPENAFPPESLSSIGAVGIPDIPELAKRVLSAWQNLEAERVHSAAFRWPEGGEAIRWEDGEGVCRGWEHDGRLAVMTDSGIVLLSSADVVGISANKRQ